MEVSVSSFGQFSLDMYPLAFAKTSWETQRYILIVSILAPSFWMICAFQESFISVWVASREVKGLGYDRLLPIEVHFTHFTHMWHDLWASLHTQPPDFFKDTLRSYNDNIG